jgi:hypothetical protein
MGAAPEVVRVLEEHPALLDEGPESDHAAAAAALVAPARTLAPGYWRPGDGMGPEHPALGILVLEGLMTRDVAVAHTTCGELVGPGELLRPWDDFGRHAPMPFEVEWKVLQSARLAVLDRGFLTGAASWPSLLAAICSRAIERSHALALHVAIHCIQRVDVSIVVLLWHLADRFGTVTSDGVVVPTHLTHADVARLVGARRPSVTAALGELARRGWVVRRADGSWLLEHEPPADMQEMLLRRRHRLRATGS